MKKTHDLMRSKLSGDWHFLKLMTDEAFDMVTIVEVFNIDTRMREILNEYRTHHTPIAIGSTVSECVVNLGIAQWPDRFVACVDDKITSYDYAWVRRFMVDGVVHEAAGQVVPGGYTLTWWQKK